MSAVYHLGLSGVPNSAGTDSVASHALDWKASKDAHTLVGTWTDVQGGGCGTNDYLHTDTT